MKEGPMGIFQKPFLTVILIGFFLGACTQGGVGLGPTSGNPAAGISSLDSAEPAGTPETPGTTVSLDPGKEYKYRYLLPNGGGPYFFENCRNNRDCFFYWVDCSEIPNLGLIYKPEDETQCHPSDWAEKWFDCSYLKECKVYTLEESSNEGNCEDCQQVIETEKKSILQLVEEDEDESDSEESPSLPQNFETEVLNKYQPEFNNPFILPNAINSEDDED